MNYIAWDTETTGFPRTRQKASHENVDLYESCRMVSIACVVYSSYGRERFSYKAIVYPDSFLVSATEIHGITHEHALQHGVPFGEIYNQMVSLSRTTNIFVAHNSHFDENVFFSECYRRGYPTEPFTNIKFKCTLRMVTQLYNRPMKLSIIYEHLFQKKLEGAHNALNDARACGEVYRTLLPSAITLRVG